MLNIIKNSGKVLVVILLLVAYNFSQSSDSVKNNDGLLEQAKLNSIKTAVSYAQDYSSKFRISTRNNKGKTSSKAYEYFCTTYGCRNILIEEDGNPLPEKKIEKNREKISKQLAVISEKPPEVKSGGIAADELKPGLKFFVYNVLLQPNLIISNCNLTFAENLEIEGRETVKFSFDNCKVNSEISLNFKRFLAYMPDSVGFLWIDKNDKAVMKAEVFMKNFEAAENREPLISMDFVRVPEGLWFWKILKVNALKNKEKFPDMKEDWQVEFSNYKLYKSDAEYLRSSKSNNKR